jgi:hypothetical protein
MVNNGKDEIMSNPRLDKVMRMKLPRSTRTRNQKG